MLLTTTDPKNPGALQAVLARWERRKGIPDTIIGGECNKTDQDQTGDEVVGGAFILHSGGVDLTKFY